ncbi:dihydroxyacetone kinase phosphoryl donor subunit DhaM [Latilactobacillus fuchuensis]|uniref:phosphoenolpyruvate--glycerone phosphotransferase n=2 Tax=Latilactobacillus fuchuensis TaxID=164393 RepID=A0A2N9DTC9_9LACO|nr:dihydroxyacetone kinase phosphoryl donor subunit DhaM [Latilactobacillus fuchuensis]KRL60838.1 PTS-dependent dihydroxyacetone kinase, phosphotransferase subunit dhaM [Latilactobacillus fuchuensis DSM 14340 = JCM 11249]MCP8857337.1 PTS-dependent dihydroxyacetone kinase phosphotransferase subunit DhaM [Latilactobacillus fuchuensis]SPC36815.1 PTS-dependent dihydroxyacetone kinase, phosphotransferase subunit DhaM [Latilactobacillus fuchuensis]
MTDQSIGVLIVSHVPEIAAGLERLIREVAADVPLTIAGGTDDNGVGTSLTKIQAAIEANQADQLLAFYDLGSAKLNLELAQEFSDKTIHLYDVALIEGAYTASALLQADASLDMIEPQLADLKIK